MGFHDPHNKNCDKRFLYCLTELNMLFMTAIITFSCLAMIGTVCCLVSLRQSLHAAVKWCLVSVLQLSLVSIKCFSDRNKSELFARANAVAFCPFP